MEKAIISQVQKILKTENVSIVERLLGGMSNYTYVIQADGKKYTYRIPGEYAEFFVDRNLEKENIRKMEQLGITNHTLYLNVQDGCKLAEYIDGKPLSTLPEYPYEKVAEALKIIHQSRFHAVNDYQPFQRLKNYELYIKDLGYVHSFRYLKLRAEFNTYQKFLESRPKTFTHGDSQPSNFVFDGAKLWVVDFEFCANNDPLYDIACFCNLKYEEGLKLLHVYFGEPSPEQLRIFQLWRCFQCLQWFNVAMFKELKGMSKTLKIDFAKVADHYLDLAEGLLNQVRS
jgi:thiamine kinase-like enzyme